MGKKWSWKAHKTYTEKVASKPVARACEGLESARQILGNPKRWTKGALIRDGYNDEVVERYCLHGALTKVFNSDNSVGYIGRYDTIVPEMKVTNTPAVNALVALAVAIKTHVNRKENRNRFRFFNKDYDAYVNTGLLAQYVYAFNDSDATKHEDIVTVLKGARKMCYEFALDNIDNGGI